MTEMTKLINMLTEANIPFELTTDVMGTPNNQVWYPTYANPVCDAICHKYSYGGKDGLLEIMGLVDETVTDDSVEGYLTAETVFNRIHAHYTHN